MENKRNLLESEVDLKDLIVIDNGTDTIKMGYSGENQPRIIIDSMTGRINRTDDNDQISNKPQHIFGNSLKQALKEKKLDITINYPIERGAIKENHWEQMKVFYINQSYWEYLMEDTLQIAEIQNCDIMIIDNLQFTKEYRSQMAEILFEEMKVQSVSFMNSSATTLFSQGQTTGLVIEAGHGITTVCPVFEGYCQNHSYQYSQVAGQDITNFIHEHLKTYQVPYNFNDNSLQTQALVRAIKHNLCIVPESHDHAVNLFHRLNIENKCFELPDGKIMEIDSKIKYTASEILFNPKIIDSNFKSLQQMIKDAFKSSDDELQQDISQNVVLSGGNTLMKGFIERIKKELDKLLPNQSFNVYNDSQRQNAAWIGGSMLGSISTFQSLSITRSEYDENPESKQFIVQKRTF